MKRISPGLAAWLLVIAFLLVVVIASVIPYLQTENGNWVQPGLQTTTPTAMLSNNITPWWTDMPTAPSQARTPTSTSTSTSTP